MFRASGTAIGSDIQSPSRLVEVLFQMFWFIGTFVEQRNGEEALHTLLARGLNELNMVCDANDWALIQVDIAVPPSESETGEWEFERLIAAWDCEDPRYPDAVAQVYCSNSGCEYSDVIPPIEQARLESLKRIKRVYPTRTVRSSDWSRSCNRRPNKEEAP